MPTSVHTPWCKNLRADISSSCCRVILITLRYPRIIVFAPPPHWGGVLQVLPQRNLRLIAAEDVEACKSVTMLKTKLFEQRIGPRMVKNTLSKASPNLHPQTNVDDTSPNRSVQSTPRTTIEASLVRVEFPSPSGGGRLGVSYLPCVSAGIFAFISASSLFARARASAAPRTALDLRDGQRPPPRRPAALVRKLRILRRRLSLLLLASRPPPWPSRRASAAAAAPRTVPQAVPLPRRDKLSRSGGTAGVGGAADSNSKRCFGVQLVSAGRSGGPAL